MNGFNAEDLQLMVQIGLFESVSFLGKLTAAKEIHLSLMQAFALVKMKSYEEAIKAVEDVLPNDLGVNDRATLFEVLLTSYIKLSRFEKLSILLKSQSFLEMEPNLKLDLLAAEGHILLNPGPNEKHLALPYLLRLYERFPYSLEVASMLMKIGFYEFHDIEHPIYNSYLHGVVDISRHKYQNAVAKFLAITNDHHNCTPALSKLCLCSYLLKEDVIFDAAAKQIPATDPEIIDLRAARLKEQRKQFELENLVTECLSTNQLVPQNWLAFSHLLELKKDITRALHTVTHAINLDKNFRRAYLRQGELRFMKNDIQRSLTSSLKAHQLDPDLDSFSAIIHCETMQQHWESASTYATSACRMFDDDSSEATMALTLLGLAQKGISQQNSLALLRKALDRDHENMEALGAIVDITVDIGDYPGALQLLADFRSPKNEFFFNFKMGEVYGFKREYQVAFDYMQRAVAIRPDNERANDLLRQLESIVSSEVVVE